MTDKYVAGAEGNEPVDDPDLPAGYGTLCDQTQEQANNAYAMSVAAGLIKVRDPSTPIDERVVAMAKTVKERGTP